MTAPLLVIYLRPVGPLLLGSRPTRKEAEELRESYIECGYPPAQIVIYAPGIYVTGEEEHRNGKR